jgi:type II secretory pathway pseudopilin PulG
MSMRFPKRVNLGREDGMALVLAVLVLAIVTIAAASAIYYTSESQQDANSKKGGLSAYSLAQAALSNANAQLVSHYYDDTGQPKDNSTSLTDQAAWAPSGSQQSPTSTSACTSTSTCMSWSAELCPDGTCPDGSTIDISGFQRAMWHITGTGTTPNPSASAPLTRKITIDVPVAQPTQDVHNPSNIFDSFYSGKGPTAGVCDMTMDEGTVFHAAVYVVGNLCISNPQAGVFTPGTLAVGGSLTMSDGNVGADSSSGLSSVGVVGSCTTKDGGTTSPCQLTKVTSGGTTFYTDDPTRLSKAEIFSTSQVSNSPTFPARPSVDFSGPEKDSKSYTCSGPSGHETLDTNPFDLAPSTSYSCTTASGAYVKWDASTSKLSVSGNVYIPGDLWTTGSGPNIIEDGVGGIFVGGSVSFANNTSICVGAQGGSHNCPNKDSYDTSSNFLLILAQGTISGDNLGLEGGLYSNSSITFRTGQTYIYGPLITPDQLIPGQQAASGIPYIDTALTNWPDTPTPMWTLATPQNGSY